MNIAHKIIKQLGRQVVTYMLTFVITESKRKDLQKHVTRLILGYPDLSQFVERKPFYH